MAFGAYQRGRHRTPGCIHCPSCVLRRWNVTGRYDQHMATPTCFGHAALSAGNKSLIGVYYGLDGMDDKGRAV